VPPGVPPGPPAPRTALGVIFHDAR
jgi:hypothetical protein